MCNRSTASKSVQHICRGQAHGWIGKTVGYERWAKKYNRKEAAMTICLLKEKDVDSYEDLVILTDKLTTRFEENKSLR